MKIVDKARVEPKLEKMWNREVATLDSLHHPNIMRLYEVSGGGANFTQYFSNNYVLHNNKNVVLRSMQFFHKLEICK